MKSIVNKNARTINIKANSDKEFFLIHGYTGSPTDFNKLGEYLNKRFNANVKIMRLKGHGEKIENIDNLNYNDFLIQVEKELKKEIKKGRKIIIGGLSMGSFIALQLATKYSIKGIFCVSIPYKYKFPVGIVSFIEPVILKKHWKKSLSEYKSNLRKDAFSYDVNLRGLRVIEQAKKQIKGILTKIEAPCLIIHVGSDKIFHKKSAFILQGKIISKIKKVSILNKKNNSSHNPFYSQERGHLYRTIGNFVEKNKLFLD